MEVDKLTELEEMVHRICDNHVFDEIDLKHFEKIIERAVNDIEEVCEQSMKQLAEKIGDYKKIG